MPSQRLRITDSWAAYQMDNAVAYLAVTVQNALAERENRGTDDRPDWRPKYTLDQLLEPEFRLPSPEDEAMSKRRQATRNLNHMIDRMFVDAAKPGSQGRVFQYVPPEQTQ